MKINLEANLLERTDKLVTALNNRDEEILKDEKTLILLNEFVDLSADYYNSLDFAQPLENQREFFNENPRFEQLSEYFYGKREVKEDQQ